MRASMHTRIQVPASSRRTPYLLTYLLTYLQVPASSRRTPSTPLAAHLGATRSSNTNPCRAGADGYMYPCRARKERSVAISTRGSIDRLMDSRHIDSRHSDRHIDRHIDSRHSDKHIDRHVDQPVGRPNGRPENDCCEGPPEECCEENDCCEGPPEEEGQQLHNSATSSASSFAPPAVVNPSAGVKLRTSSANLPSPPLPSANLASPPLHEELQRLAWLRLSGLRAEKEAERHNQLASVYWRYRPPGSYS